MEDLDVLKIMLKQYEERNCYSQAEALKWAIEFIEDRLEKEKLENFDIE